MNKIIGSLTGIVAGVGLLMLFASGIFTKLVEFGAWLFMLQYSGPETSIFGEVFVRLLTFAVTFGLVRIIFESFGWFNSDAMSVAYWIISTILSFIFSYIVWTTEQYLLVIGIVLGVVAVLIVAFFVLRAVILKRKKKNAEEQHS